MSEPPGTIGGPMLRVAAADCTSLVERTLNQLGNVYSISPCIEKSHTRMFHKIFTFGYLVNPEKR